MSAGSIRAASSGLTWRTFEPWRESVAAEHGFDNHDCFRQRTEKWVDQPCRNGAFVAVITGIVRFVVRMARFLIIMGMSVISLPVVLIRGQKARRIGHLGARLAVKVELGTQGRRQQQGQRQHSEQEGSQKVHVVVTGPMPTNRQGNLSSSNHECG